MNRSEYRRIERCMLECLQDTAHDKDHVYRVLYNAMAIAQEEPGADMDILITACLLHDIGRPEQIADPRLCHAEVGAQKAFAFLSGIGWVAVRAEHVRQCILSHRFRKSNPPATVEAKILYDADKLDVTGAIGAARTLAYNGAVGQPIYTTAEDGTILDGSGDEPGSYFHEHRWKLEKVYDRFLTAAGARMAKERYQAADDFYRSVLREVRDTARAGQNLLADALE